MLKWLFYYPKVFPIFFIMDDSDEEGFHQATLEFMTVKIKNILCNPHPRVSALRQSFNRHPINMHYEIKFY